MLEHRFEWCWKAFAEHLIYWKYSKDYKYAAWITNRSEVFKHYILCSEYFNKGE